MAGAAGPDWNPASYARFGDARLRPALDLLERVGALPEGRIIDLGCGNGQAARALSARFPNRPLIGVDNSPAMLEKAAETGLYSALLEDDAAVWAPDEAPALIFSNALCHWLSDHAQLFARLAGFLAAGGTLAVQMPRQFEAPSHSLLREIAHSLFPALFDYANWRPPVAAPQEYARMLALHGKVSVWETQYIQRLDAGNEGHPVRLFTQSTAMRPIIAKLNARQRRQFMEAYDDALKKPYPAEDDGSVLFPFRRVFFTLQIA